MCVFPFGATESAFVSFLRSKFRIFSGSLEERRGPRSENGCGGNESGRHAPFVLCGAGWHSLVIRGDIEEPIPRPPAPCIARDKWTAGRHAGDGDGTKARGDEELFNFSQSTKNLSHFMCHLRCVTLPNSVIGAPPSLAPAPSHVTSSLGQRMLMTARPMYKSIVDLIEHFDVCP